MSLHRVTLVALAALFTAGMTSVAAAGCCGWGVQAPVVYAPTGCGSCGTPTAAIVYVQPVAPSPPPVPVVVSAPHWGCGCRRPVVYAAPVLEPTPVAPAPIYIVNQGPSYTGPGIVVPYRTWTQPAYVPAEYPYVPSYYRVVHHFYRPVPHRVAYHQPSYVHPHRYMPVRYWRSHPYRPLHVRG